MKGAQADAASVALAATVPVTPGANEGDGAGGGDARGRATTSVGMAVALGAVAMTFAAVLFAYAVVRAQSPSWPPPGEGALPRGWPWPLFAVTATAAAIAASLAMRAAHLAARMGPSGARRLMRAVMTAAACGCAFIAVQIAGWFWLTSLGIRPDSGLLASVVYGLTIFHALHAGAALVVLAPLLLTCLRGRRARVSAVAAVASFWHLVTVAWLVVFFAVYVA